MNIRVICTMCEGDPVNSDGSLCFNCEGSCVIELDEEDVRPHHSICDSGDEGYMQLKWDVK